MMVKITPSERLRERGYCPTCGNSTVDCTCKNDTALQRCTDEVHAALLACLAAPTGTNRSRVDEAIRHYQAAWINHKAEGTGQ